MAKYRLKEYDYETHKSYLLQRKSIFGFWYNPENIDANTTGWYDTEEEGIQSIKKRQIKAKKKVVFQLEW